MFNVPLLQFLCEVKQRAIEELQLQERPPGKLLGVKHNCVCKGFPDHLPPFNSQSIIYSESQLALV